MTTTDDHIHPLARTLTRRGALRASGVALVGAAALAACSDDETEIAVTGTTGPEQTTTTLPAPTDDDLVFLRTAASYELTAAAFYSELLGAEDEPAGELRETALLMQAHHEQHAELLDSTIEGLGGEPVDETNDALDESLVTDPLATATTEAQILEAALALEEVGAGAYVDAGGTLSRADLRKRALSIGGSDARHVAYLEVLLDHEAVPTAFAEPVPFPDDALLPPGEITEPAAEGEESTDDSTPAAEGEAE